MKHTYKAFVLLVAGVLLFSGCTSGESVQTAMTSETEAADTEEETAAQTNLFHVETEASPENVEEVTAEVVSPKTDEETEAEETAEENSYFSSRDLSGEIDTDSAVAINLNGDSISCSSSDVSIAGTVATVTAGGTYILTGTLENGYIVVDAGKDDKVQLVLNGISVTSSDFAAIYTAQADKTFITLAEETENTLSNGGSFTQIDDNSVNAVIYSKDDLTLNGTGSLTITSPAGHGIVGKDEVTLADGNCVITAGKSAIKSHESIAVAGGSWQLTAGSDGMHSENNDDDTLGSIYIAGGTFVINAGDDGIHATTLLQIDGGTLDVNAAEGLEATYILINGGDITVYGSDDGINASDKSSLYSTPTVEINGGSVTVSVGAGDTDCIDANGIVVINGGTVTLTGNSTIDYDISGTINGGTVIANGQQITTITNQQMGGGGGHGGKNGNMGGGRW